MATITQTAPSPKAMTRTPKSTPKSARFSTSAFSSPRSARSPSTATSSPTVSTPASSVNTSPVTIKRQTSIADLTANWRNRSQDPLTKRPSLEKIEEDGLLPAPSLLHHTTNTSDNSSDYPDSSDSDRDLSLNEAFSAIRISLPTNSFSPVRVPVPPLTAPVTPVNTATRQTPMSLPQLLHRNHGSRLLQLATPTSVPSLATSISPITARTLPSLPALQSSSNSLASVLSSNRQSLLHVPPSIFDRLSTAAAAMSPASTASVSVSHPALLSATSVPTIACSVCDTSASPTSRGELTMLEPCKHLVCRACMTHALNIVGDKAFVCMSCEAPIANFSLISGNSSERSPFNTTAATADHVMALPPQSHGTGLASFILASNRNASLNAAAPNTSAEPSVLRIDNCPWDVTPPMLTAWVTPVEPLAAHVLLDRKGKTLSHAFVELRTREDARLVLRACRSKILGSGRRARGVTITLSTQDELRSQLFPNCVFGTAQMVPGDVECLSDLISNGTVFIKDPSLPHWLLASLLRKISSPSYEHAAQDKLFTLVVIAADKLLADPRAFNPAVLPAVLNAARGCVAFSRDQHQQLDCLWRNVCALVFAPAAATL
ncbi:hypothetical protein BKA62DRAFT_691982 [Auriculariales sp. MPI-PUGE-AT-0066]|nr:hypothetical protein BKA62DRAFT_691982 [Auriculariales sp. MPI-PUGE-AT-0066]